MAVYTEVSDEALRAFLSEYDLGGLLAFRGIAEGVENSNYALRTERGDFILTLYEKRVDPEELPYFLGLMDHLAARGLPCPTPVHGRDGTALRQLCESIRHNKAHPVILDFQRDALGLKGQAYLHLRGLAVLADVRQSLLRNAV